MYEELNVKVSGFWVMLSDQFVIARGVRILRCRVYDAETYYIPWGLTDF